MAIENADDFEYPRDPQKLMKVIEDQEGPPTKCPYTKAAIMILSGTNIPDSIIDEAIDGARGLRRLNLLVYGVPYSAHSVNFRKETK